MNQIRIDLYDNIKSGIQLCLFRRLSPEAFRVSLDQVVLLILLNLLADLSHDYLVNLPSPSFNLNGILAESFSILMLVFACYIINCLFFNQEVTFSLSVLILSISPPLTVVWTLIDVLMKKFPEGLISIEVTNGIFALWVFAVFFWSIRTFAGDAFRNVILAFGALMVIWVGPSEYFTVDYPFWISMEEAEADDDHYYDAYEALDVEGIYYAQPQLLAQALQGLHPGKSGKKDVFFIGVGAWAFQDVFLKETLYAKGLFDERFESQNRSLALINNLSTYETIPLATSHNLKEALQYIGTIMNVDEDLLIMYMTSHGSKNHKLSVNFWPLELNDISPDMLRQYLDEAGIQWRVIMVSACYSGGFIEPLQTAHSAIASASAPDRQSFGCSNTSEFTYFGEALLKDQLQEVYSFPLAFAEAIRAISKREAIENLEASQPQLFIGDKMNSYLKIFSDDLERRAQIKVASGK